MHLLNDTRISLLVTYPREITAYVHKKTCAYWNVYSFVHNTPNLATGQVFISKRMTNQIVVCWYNVKQHWKERADDTSRWQFKFSDFLVQVLQSQTQNRINDLPEVAFFLELLSWVKCYSINYFELPGSRIPNVHVSTISRWYLGIKLGSFIVWESGFLGG